MIIVINNVMKPSLLLGLLLVGIFAGVSGIAGAASISDDPNPDYLNLDTPQAKTVGDVVKVTGTITDAGMTTFGNVWAINFGPDTGSSSSRSSTTQPTIKNHGMYTFGSSRELSYSIPTAGLPPGRYVVEVTASTKEGTMLRTFSSRVSFNLVSPDMGTPIVTQTPLSTTVPLTNSTTVPTTTTAPTASMPTKSPGFGMSLGLLALGCAAVLLSRRQQ